MSHPTSSQFSVTVPTLNMLSRLDLCVQILVDGYISQSFSPQQAERYFPCVLKSNSFSPFLGLPAPGSEGAFFLVNSVPRHISLHVPGQPHWILDRSIVNRGTVVPQTLWTPHTVTDKKHHVEEAELQLPIFFQCVDGQLGLTLEAAASGRCHGLVGAQNFAHLGLKSTTHIRIVVSGIFRFRS